MIGDRPSATALADLASNVFALCLITLLVLAAAARHAPAPETVDRPLDIVRDLNATERQPLPASATVELLRARRPAAAGLSIDLGPTGATLTVGGASRRVGAADLAAALRAVAPGVPVRLYVLGHDLYPAVQRQLMASGLTVQEMSVPLALAAPDRETLSSGFLALLARADDPSAFRQGLANLLDGGGPRSGRAGGESAAAPARSISGTVAAALAVLRDIWQVFAVATGLGVVIVVERRRRKRLRSCGGAGLDYSR